MINNKILNDINSKQLGQGLEIISNVLKVSDIGGIFLNNELPVENIIETLDSAKSVLDVVGTTIEISSNLTDLI
ncbi:MAG: hypothetical protein K2X69_10320 [Silvanigrellaceae bacterium]|nr:hypothetical protein [Silvanigrellaceae bacterium]